MASCGVMCTLAVASISLAKVWPAGSAESAAACVVRCHAMSRDMSRHGMDCRRASSARPPTGRADTARTEGRKEGLDVTARGARSARPPPLLGGGPAARGSRDGMASKWLLRWDRIHILTRHVVGAYLLGGGRRRDRIDTVPYRSITVP